MKTSFLIIVIFLSSIGLYSQQEDLFDRNWYVTEMVVDGNSIPIPVLSSNQPEGCFVGIKIYSHGNGEGSIDLGLCWSCVANIVSITESTFVSWGVACLLCMDCGPCNPNGTTTICTQGYLHEFEFNQNVIFDESQGTYIYTITPLPNDHLELRIDKPNGDYIIYGTESTLSIKDIEIFSFSIVPNPASSSISLKGLKSDVKSVEIYTLNGSKLPIALAGNSYDVSHLAAGIYFISVTSVDGQKSVQRLIKL